MADQRSTTRSKTRSERLFQEWIELSRQDEPPSRDEFLGEEPDSTRAEVERIIDAYELARSSIREGGTFKPGSKVGEFLLKEELGRGGMAAVWEAEQVTMKRRVALKLLFPHLTFSERSLERFRREAEAGGRLAHQGLVQVYGVGEADGVYFMAQELVHGGFTLADSLAQMRDRKELPEGYDREVAELFVRIADALEHAHKHGVIHRDIKPSNILIADNDQPKIADFGLAQVEDQLALSRTGEFMGTPFYMSPEQASSKRMGLDHRTDVFSLGSTLYEALTLQRPFGGDTSQQVFSKILTAEPPEPRTIRSKLPRDLGVICMKALEKSPERRYASMGELAADLRRFLADESILAKPPGPVTRAFKWTRRHPLVSTSGAIGVVALTVISGLFLEVRDERDQNKKLVGELEVAVEEANDARMAEETAREAESSALDATKTALAEVRRQSYALNVAAAENALQAGNVVEARRRLEDSPLENRGWEWEHLALAVDTSLMTLDAGFTSATLEYSADGGRLVARPLLGDPVLWDLASGERIAELAGHGERVVFVRFSPDGSRIATGSKDKTLRIWDGRTGRHFRTLEGHRGWVRDAAFNPSVTKLVSAGHDKLLYVWDVATGEQLLRLKGHKKKVRSTVFSADGSRIVSMSDDRTVRTWDAVTGELLSILTDDSGKVSGFSVSASLDRVISFEAGERFQLFDLATGEAVARVTAHDLVHDPALSPDGRFVATCGADDKVRLFSALDGAELATFEGHRSGVSVLAFSPDSRLLAAGGNDVAIRLYDTSTLEELGALRGHLRPVRALAFGPRSEVLASASLDGTIRVWAAQSNRVSTAFEAHSGAVQDIAYHPSGDRFATAYKSIRIWDARTGEYAATFTGTDETLLSIAFSPEGRKLYGGGADGSLRVWDAENGDLLNVLRERKDTEGQLIRNVALVDLAAHPDGGRLALALASGTVAVIDAATGETLMETERRGIALICLAYDSTGTRIAAAGTSALVHLFDAETGEELHVFERHESRVNSVAFSPGDRFLVSCSSRMNPLSGIGGSGAWNSRLLLWDVEAGERVADLYGHDGSVADVTFSPDGQRIVSGASDKTLRLWDGTSGDALAKLTGHEATVSKVVFDPTGRRLVSGSTDGVVRIWETDLADARGTWAAAERLRRLQTRVDQLALEHETLDSVLAVLRGDGSLAPRDLRTAERLAGRTVKTASALRSKAWEVVCQGDASSEEYEAALRDAERACTLDPDGAENRTTLGVAQYRAGRFQECVDTLTNCAGLDSASDIPEDFEIGEVNPRILAFLAMGAWQLGDRPQGKVLLETASGASRRAKEPDEALAVILAEAEALMAAE